MECKDTRPSTPSESLEQSIKEMQLMREGKLPKKDVESVKRRTEE